MSDTILRRQPKPERERARERTIHADDQRHGKIIRSLSDPTLCINMALVSDPWSGEEAVKSR